MTQKQKAKKQKHVTKPTIIDQIKNSLSEVFVVWKVAKGESANTGGIYGIFSAKEIAEKVIENEQERLGPDSDVKFTYGSWIIDYRWHNMKPAIKYWKSNARIKT